MQCRVSVSTVLEAKLPSMKNNAGAERGSLEDAVGDFGWRS